MKTYVIQVAAAIIFFADLSISQTYLDEKSKSFDIFDFTIPWPSGIAIDTALDDHNNTFRFGRLQHNIIQLRPKWDKIKTTEKVFTKKECKSIIKKAEDYAFNSGSGWITGRHIDYQIRPTSDIPIDIIYTGDELSTILNRIHEKILSQFHNDFGLDPSRLRISDLFITKYNASVSDRRQLGPHQDKSQWSFVIPLNAKFEGGGTYFFDTQEMWRPPIGTAVYFSGTKLHGGSPIRSGVRYILAGFCDYGDIDSHETFMEIYDPEYDGYAADSGFRTGDLIVGLETCDFGQVHPVFAVEQENSTETIDDDDRDVETAAAVSNRIEFGVEATDALVCGDGSNQCESSTARGSMSTLTLVSQGQESLLPTLDTPDSIASSELPTTNSVAIISRETAAIDDSLPQKAKIIRRMTSVHSGMSDDEWVAAAQSCERLAPGESTVIRVRRKRDESVGNGR